MRFLEYSGVGRRVRFKYSGDSRMIREGWQYCYLSTSQVDFISRSDALSTLSLSTLTWSAWHFFPQPHSMLGLDLVKTFCPCFSPNDPHIGVCQSFIVIFIARLSWRADSQKMECFDGFVPVPVLVYFKCFPLDSIYSIADHANYFIHEIFLTFFYCFMKKILMRGAWLLSVKKIISGPKTCV